MDGKPRVQLRRDYNDRYIELALPSLCLLLFYSFCSVSLAKVVGSKRSILFPFVRLHHPSTPRIQTLKAACHSLKRSAHLEAVQRSSHISQHNRPRTSSHLTKSLPSTLLTARVLTVERLHTFTKPLNPSPTSPTVSPIISCQAHLVLLPIMCTYTTHVRICPPCRQEDTVLISEQLCPAARASGIFGSCAEGVLCLRDATTRNCWACRERSRELERLRRGKSRALASRTLYSYTSWPGVDVKGAAQLGSGTLGWRR